MPKARPMPRLSWPPHVSGRDGRPRFQPGPELRAMGFRGRDLKTPEGQWMTPGEAHAAMGPVIRDIEAARARAREVSESTRRRDAQQRAEDGHYTVRQLCADFIAWHDKNQAVSLKRGVKPKISPVTLASYRSKLKRLLETEPKLARTMPAAINQHVAMQLYERLLDRHSASVAAGWCRALSAAMALGKKRLNKVSFAVNPFHDLDMQQGPGRKNAASREAISHLVAVADRMGRPDVGDMITAGTWLGARQKDRINLTHANIIDGRVHIHTSKTGASLSIPISRELRARLAAMSSRRAGTKIVSVRLFIDERLNTGWTASRYARAYAEVRRAAVSGLPASAAGPALPAMPAVADIEDRDMRATAVTWLSKSGCSLSEIKAVTGHSLSTIVQLLDRNYLKVDDADADIAISKMEERFGNET